MAFLEVKAVNFSYGVKTILRDVSFSVEEGGLVSLLGKSGSGKTTLLRLCAGLEERSHGNIHVGGRLVAHRQSFETSIGFVFQDFALFEHLSVQKNLEYGCRSPSDFDVLNEMIDLFGIEDLSRRMPGSLSGGERQRVALARALALRPRLLLMDEPFASIDRDQTKEFLSELREIFRKLKVTAVMVTHSLDEAIQFSDRILFMENGCIVQDGPISEFYVSPNSDSVKAFFGNALWIRGEVRDGCLIADGGSIEIKPESGLSDGEEVEFFVQAPQRFIFKTDRY